jgi:sugar O-acyltransferase (sialic acid O-acetyltransferase NeuD family)
MKKHIFIFGLGTLADLAEYYITYDMNLSVSGYLIDDEFKISDIKNGIKVFGWSEFKDLFSVEHVKIFCAIGYKSFRNRELLYQKIKESGFEFFNIISQYSFIADNVSLGNNLFIMPGVVIEPKAIIGNNNVFWSNATICHDVKIEEHNFIAANSTIGGFSKIGSKNFIGFSSTIIENLSIGDNNLIGAQSLIIEKLENNLHVHGSPAKLIKKICSVEGITL